jgi:hypothetical protein
VSNNPVFDKPQNPANSFVVLPGSEGRTQEFVLRVAKPWPVLQEIVRQQYNFSPLAATREVEDYGVDLDEVTALELRILPDVSGGSACGSLAEWFLA